MPNIIGTIILAVIFFSSNNNAFPVTDFLTITSLIKDVDFYQLNHSTDVFKTSLPNSVSPSEHQKFVLGIIFCYYEQPNINSVGQDNILTPSDSQYKEVIKNFAGEWQLETSDNFDAYLEVLFNEIGINIFLRLMSKFIKNTLIIIPTDDIWHIKAFSSFKNYEIKFRLGEKFKSHSIDGRHVGYVFQLYKDGKLVEKETALRSNEKDSIITRWVENDKLIAVVRSGSVVAKRVYKRVR
uniref:Lipocln_cytosolic_FA-bd_dom domain-containing protein n=1 Tax=Syphacia muris TaxID=451379 RepID=A0A0N5AD86_9BILA